MTDDKLQLSWETTRGYLNAARELLPTIIRSSEKGFSIERYLEWLEHNELELAFDELENLGIENNCLAQFWQELFYAAQTMELYEHAERCQNQINQFKNL